MALAAAALSGPAGAQNGTDPPCAPGVAPAATIRGFDVEDGGGGQLTATHTISLEARGPDGPEPRAQFTLPAGAQNRGDESDPAFSVDTPGPVPVTATWSHYVEADGSSCTAERSGHALGSGRQRSCASFASVPAIGPSRRSDPCIGAGKNADLRPVQLRLRGVRRARLPGRTARLRTLTLALRRGDKGLSLGQSRRLRTAGLAVLRRSVADEHNIDIRTTLVDNRRGRRGPARGFGYAVELVQAGDRVGRIRVIGRCGYLGCRWRALR